MGTDPQRSGNAVMLVAGVPEVEVRFQLTAEDIPLVQDEIARHAPELEGRSRVKVGDIDRPVWIGLVSMASVAVVSVALMAWLIFDGRVSGSYILIGLAFGGILASLLYYCCFLAIAAAQQRVRDQHEQSETNLFAPRVMTLTDRGVLVEYWNTTTLILWPGIIKLVVAERFLMLFDGPLSAHVVPTRAFAGETERQQFVDRCRDHLGPKASAWAPDKRSGITERLQ